MSPGPVPLWGTQAGPRPLTYPTPQARLARLPNAVALTQSTQLADWLKGKDYNVGWAELGWAGKPQSARAGSSLSTRPGLPVGVLQSHHPQGVQIPPGEERERVSPLTKVKGQVHTQPRNKG